MTRRQLTHWVRRAQSAFISDSMVFFVVYLAVLGGLPILIDPTVFAPVSIQTQLSAWLVRFWGVDLTAGGLLCGFGLLSERPRVERAGLACLFTGAMIFAIVIFVYGGLPTLLPFLTYTFFAVSAIARFRKLGKVQKGIDFAREINGE